MTDNPLTIVELRAENVKRIRSVRIVPDPAGNLVILGGKNGQGKSSVLDAICMALGGGKQIPEMPVRAGSDRAEIVIDLGDMVVRRTITDGGGGSLTVTNRDGSRYSSPQTMLDDLVGRLAFDPLAFSREPAKRQLGVLRELLGVDFEAADKDRASLYAERTVANRLVAAAKSALESEPEHRDAPRSAVSVAKLVADLEEARRVNLGYADMRRSLAVMHQDRKMLSAKIDELERQRRKACEEADALDAKILAHEGMAPGWVDVDERALRREIDGAEAINAKVAHNAKVASRRAELQAKQAEADELTASIQKIDEWKEQTIAAAKMPVPGLGMADGGVTLNGLPLSQASSAEQLRVSVAIGLAMNPRLRVLMVRDASLLDSASLALMGEMAREAGAQLWVERVTDGGADGCSIVIEDGEVLGAESAPPLQMPGPAIGEALVHRVAPAIAAPTPATTQQASGRSVRAPAPAMASQAPARRSWGGGGAR